MKQWVIAGMLTGSLALAGAVAAQDTQQPPASTPAATAQSPAATPPAATKKRAPRRHANTAAADQAGAHQAPKDQPTTAPAADFSDKTMALGTVRIPREVKADGKPLPAGTYQIRLTAEDAKPEAAGTSDNLERWVEFVQHGQVKGREVATIVPQAETKLIEKDAPPHPGAAKVQMLKGGDYLRVWINRGGNQYLIHLVV
ncbi:MAG TPA: hypothetical protein VFX12_15420 [Vicinamibacterales bacterium]|nr:hypothetical protein [Vicinamibacterales bacterium]